MEKIRVGFIGVGGIAGTHLENVNKNEHASIVAVCDIDPNRARQVGEQYGVHSYISVDDMLHHESLDALFVCVPPFAHGDMEEKAAKRRIHLMVEKPLGLDLSNVRNKEKAIVDSGIICATGYCLRYLDTVAKAKEFLRGKQIAMIRAHYVTKFVQTPWYRKMALSGGQLVEQSTHTVDLIRYLAGDFRTVYTNTALQVMSDIPDIDIPDVTSVNFTMESGTIGNLSSTFTQADHHTGIEIMGRDFRVVLDGTSLHLFENGNKVSFESKIDFYKEQDHAFIEAIRLNKKELILSPYSDAVKTLAVTLAANHSANTGQPKQLEDFLLAAGK
ncbi:Gfo/Idh/MocA family protein [Neobacillus drentensis]|uniref:Gfo/Idh/MocA family protein n=1 Tax=Neobacillus drentensis TaxID=220684 RepID=UPI003003A1B5